MAISAERQPQIDFFSYNLLNVGLTRTRTLILRAMVRNVNYSAIEKPVFGFFSYIIVANFVFLNYCYMGIGLELGLILLYCNSAGEQGDLKNTFS